MASTSKGPGKRQKWDKDLMTMAILAIQEGRMGYLKASKTFKVPKTTLIRLCQKKNKPLQEVTNMKLGRKSTLPAELETELAEYVLQMEESGFGLTRRDIMLVAYQLAEKNNLTHNFSKEKQSAGKTWLRLFLKRRPELSFRQPTGTSIARQKGFNKENVNGFFKLLEDAMDKYKYTANNIYNVDETGISVVPSKMPEILAKKGKRQIAATTSAERGSTVTCVLCMNASGSFVPPMMIFPRKRDHPLLMKGAPHGAIHACHPSGWIQTNLFTQWFKHFLQHVKPSVVSPVLLVLDGHASHTRNIELIDLARENHVQLLSLPPHSSHKIQPLDRTFMGPLKKYFIEEIRQFVRNESRAATHYDIAELFGRAYVKAQRAELAINGFRVTGICPLDKSVFQDHDFIDDDQNDQSIAADVHPSQQTQPRAQSPSASSDNDGDDHDSDKTFFDESVPTVDEPQSTDSTVDKTIDIRAQKPVVSIGESVTDALNEVQSLARLALAASSQFSELLFRNLSPEQELSAIVEIPVLANITKTNKIEVAQNANPSIDTSDFINLSAGPSTSSAYISPKQLFPVPRLRTKSSNRGRKATKSTFLTSSPYKLDLESSIKRKEEVELLKKKRNFTKDLEEPQKNIRTQMKTGKTKILQEEPKNNTGRKTFGLKKKNKKEPKKNTETKYKSEPKRKLEHKKKQPKENALKKRKTSGKLQNQTSSSDDGNYSVNDDTDESPDRCQNENAKCLYCEGLFSEDIRGEQWIQCPSCGQWAHEECAGVEGVDFLCEFCIKD